MQDATHYPWLKPGQAIGAHTVASLRGPDGGLACWRVTRLNELGDPEPVPLEEALAAPLGSALVAIDVYANHGRWIAECPDCHDAQLAVRDDPRYMCNECGNASIGGVWRPVNWPKDVAAIEALLDVRPLSHARNWAPGEKPKDLQRENRERGVA